MSYYDQNCLKRGGVCACGGGMCGVDERLKTVARPVPPSAVELKISDLRIDTYRPGGSGGFVCRPDTAVRLTHVPSGIYIDEKDDRSPHRNRAEAMRKMQLMFDLHPELFAPPPNILAAHEWDNNSLEAQFHKLITPFITKKQQGYVMGAFRELFKEGVPDVRR